MLILTTKKNKNKQKRNKKKKLEETKHFCKYQDENLHYHGEAAAWTLIILCAC